jgi:hypothetical protein
MFGGSLKSEVSSLKSEPKAGTLAELAGGDACATIALMRRHSLPPPMKQKKMSG